MIRLTPMTENKYHRFTDISVRDQIEWYVTAEGAHALIERQPPRILPKVQETPDHFFNLIIDETQSTQVGYLWYAIQQSADKRQMFVWDIQIDAQFRRMGYGTATFLALEEKAKEMGDDKISRHVMG